MKTCENCGHEHDGTYGSGRFCSTKCSRGFSTKAKRTEINERVSKSLIEYKLKINNGLTVEERIANKKLQKRASYTPLKEPTSLIDLSRRTVGKIMKRLKIGCSNCGWYVEGVNGDLHHIIPKSKNGSNEHSNITYLCPNCHRLAHSDKINPDDFVNLETQIGDRWKEFYFVKKDQ